MITQSLLPNHYVKIKYQGFADSYYQVDRVEPFQYRTGEESTAVFSAVASAETSGVKNFTQLDPKYRPTHLFEIVPGVKYAMRYYFKIPLGTDRWGTDEDSNIGFIDQDISPFEDPNEHFKFWAVNNAYPQVDVTNDCSISLTPKIQFLGYKYNIKKVEDSEVIRKLNESIIPHKEIIVGGLEA